MASAPDITKPTTIVKAKPGQIAWVFIGLFVLAILFGLAQIAAAKTMSGARNLASKSTATEPLAAFLA